MPKICKNHEVFYRQAFRAGKTKATPARLAILEALAHATRPLSAEEVKNRLPEGGADLATVYRNLEKLKTAGWVTSLNISSQTAYFELSNLDHHHHLVCEACGRIVEVRACSAGQLPQRLVKSRGFAEVRRHSLEYFGICGQCAKNN